MDTSTINWEVFPIEEQEALQKLMKMGERDNIAGGVLEMTPAKEFELQKIGTLMRPVPDEFESSVMEKYVKDRLSQNLPASPQTPEEEAILQKALDEERLAFQKEHQEQNEKRLADLERTAKLHELTENVEKKRAGRPPKLTPQSI